MKCFYTKYLNFFSNCLQRCISFGKNIYLMPFVKKKLTLEDFSVGALLFTK